MATYPIKMLRDENQEPFVPMVSADSIYMNDGKSFEEKLAGKIGVDNLAEGTGINIETKDDITTISVDFGASDNIIDNLDTTVAGQGPLDARQGNVLKNMIPTIVDSLDSTDATKVLSANQGHELKEMSVPTGGSTGQVLKKASNNDHELEWGDAADPNAIVGDGSIMKIIELTYAEYKTLESNGDLKEDTEYHITDVENGSTTYITKDQIQDLINTKTQGYLPLSGGTITGGLKTPYVNFSKTGMVLQNNGNGILRSVGNGSCTALQSFDPSSNMKTRLQFDPNFTLNYYYLDANADEDGTWGRFPIGPIKMIEKTITTTDNGTADIGMKPDDCLIVTTYHPGTTINGMVFHYVYNNNYYIKACGFANGFVGIGNTTFTLRIFYIDR